MIPFIAILIFPAFIFSGTVAYFLLFLTDRSGEIHAEHTHSPTLPSSVLTKTQRGEGSRSHFAMHQLLFQRLPRTENVSSYLS